MEGSSRSKIKIMVVIAAIVMFCFQCEIALMKLIYPPVDDFTHVEKIENVDLPLVTVCPTEQSTNWKFLKFGYGSNENLLSGHIGLTEDLNITSWGGFHNLTYNELKSQIFDLKAVKSIRVYSGKEKAASKIVYIPKYGYCKEISNYSSYYGLWISAAKKYSKLRVFMTDRNFKTYFSVDYSSHEGSSIETSKAEEHWYEVSLHTVSSCQIAPDKLKQDDYDKCVNENILNTVGKLLGCVPPWMSPHNQCNSTYEFDFAEKHVQDFSWEFVKSPVSLRNMNLELTCRKHCSTTTVNVQLVEMKKKKYYVVFSTEVNIAFNREAEVKEKFFDYSFYQLLSISY